MKVGLVESLTLIKHIKEGLDFCDIVISGVPYKIFGSYNENMQFLTKRVLYETRPDIYEGKMIEVVANVVEKSVIQTVAEETGTKLIPSESQLRPVCNHALDSIQPGDRLRDVIVYLSNVTVDSSPRAKWYDLSVVDAKSKVYSVRYFSRKQAPGVNEEQTLQVWVGGYIVLNMLALTKYGLQVDGSDDLPAIRTYHVDVLLPPEVEVAISIIRGTVKDDTQLLSYMEKYSYIDKLKTVIETEPGFHLVRVATELMIIKMLTNVTNIYPEQTLIRAAICARGYLIDRKNDYSKVVLNVNRIARTDLISDGALIDCIDVMSEHTSPVKRIYIEIAKFANFIVDERRGLIDEKEIMLRNAAVSNSYGRLL